MALSVDQTRNGGELEEIAAWSGQSYQHRNRQEHRWNNVVPSSLGIVFVGVMVKSDARLIL